MKKTLLLVSFFSWSLQMWAQDPDLFAGYVYDATTEAPISNALIKKSDSTIAKKTNEEGYFYSSKTYGSFTLTIEKEGYQTYSEEINHTGATTKTFYLTPINIANSVEELDEIIINASVNKIDIRKPEMSVNKLTAEEIKKLPVVLGETDILKSLLLLPGVVNSGEGTSGFNVRGGGNDQNLLLLDQSNVYSSSHLYGFFSVFNNDAVKNIKLYKGGIPARYGGRASSVLEINQKVGDYENLKVNGGIGLLSSRLTVEGPIVKDKLSYLVSGRGSYAHLFLKLTDINSTAYFYDVNAKLSYNIKPFNELHITSYFGRDIFKFNDTFDNNFGNTIVSANYNHRFNDNLKGQLYTNYTDYYYNLSLGFVGFNWTSGILNYDVKYQLDHRVSDKLNLKYGFQAQYYNFNPGLIEPDSPESQINRYEIPRKYAFEPAAFIEAEQEISDILRVNYGVRYSQFYRMGEESINQYANNNAVIFNPTTDAYEKATPIGEQFYGKNKKISFYDNFEPRLAVSVQMQEDQSLKISYSKMAQYIHVISNTNAATPLDIWEPSGPYIKPQIVHQYAVGYFQNFGFDKYSLEIESYFKAGKNRLDYIDGADLIGNRAIEQVLLNGKTEAYGLEFLFRKNTGKLNGWIAYTIAKSMQQTEGRTPDEKGINNGEWYRTPYDRLHDLTIVANYQLTPKWNISGNFTLQSGRPVTYPVGKYQFLDQTINDFNSRNNYSLPAFHHLDLSATYTPKPDKKKGWQGEWVFSIYNVYNRKNAASISFRESEDYIGKTEAVKLSIFGIVPSVTYNFKF